MPPAEGVSRLLQKGSAVIVTINNKEHKITVDDVNDQMVKITIESDPMEVTINKGESKLIDVEGGTLEITYNGIYPPKGKWADLTIKLSAAPAP